MCMYESSSNDSQGRMSLVKGWDGKRQETTLQGFMLGLLTLSPPSLQGGMMLRALETAAKKVAMAINYLCNSSIILKISSSHALT